MALSTDTLTPPATGSTGAAHAAMSSPVVVQVRYIYREQDCRGPQGTPVGMDKILPSVHREVASNIRKMSGNLKAPVATDEEMQKNREYLCLKASMHTAVALLHCKVDSAAHSISPAGMQSLILGAKRASSRPMFVHAFRHVRLGHSPLTRIHHLPPCCSCGVPGTRSTPPHRQSF